MTYHRITSAGELQPGDSMDGFGEVVTVSPMVWADPWGRKHRDVTFRTHADGRTQTRRLSEPFGGVVRVLRP